MQNNKKHPYFPDWSVQPHLHLAKAMHSSNSFVLHDPWQVPPAPGGRWHLANGQTWQAGKMNQDEPRSWNDSKYCRSTFDRTPLTSTDDRIHLSQVNVQWLTACTWINR